MPNSSIHNGNRKEKKEIQILAGTLTKVYGIMDISSFDKILPFVKELGCHITAVMVGLCTYKILPKAFRILVLFLAVGLLVEIIQRYQVIPDSAVYNYYLVLDCGLQLIVAYFLFADHRKRPLLITAFLLFSAAWVSDLLQHGIDPFLDRGMLANAIVLVSIYILLLYHITMAARIPVRKVPEFWLCFGIILFYGCNIPYFAFFRYLNEHDIRLSAFFLGFITQTLSNIYYLLTIYSLLLVAMRERPFLKSKIKRNGI